MSSEQSARVMGSTTRDGMSVMLQPAYPAVFFQGSCPDCGGPLDTSAGSYCPQCKASWWTVDPGEDEAVSSTDDLTDFISARLDEDERVRVQRGRST